MKLVFDPFHSTGLTHLFHPPTFEKPCREERVCFYMSTDPNIVEFHKGLKRLRQKQQKACEKRRYARFTIVDKVLTGEELFQSRLDAEVEYSDASAITRVKESTVDHGYYVFAVMRGGVAVFIGTCDGSGRQRMGLFEAQQKYQAAAQLYCKMDFPNNKH